MKWQAQNGTIYNTLQSASHSTETYKQTYLYALYQPPEQLNQHMSIKTILPKTCFLLSDFCKVNIKQLLMGLAHCITKHG